jgi:hypothetical protein
MRTVWENFALVALFAVIMVMFMGGRAMVGGTRADAKEAGRLMRWRILLQAVAIALLLAGALHLFD